jgi:ABC-2 type transport system permease protein
MALPLSKLDLLAGYGIAFALVAAVQASVTAAVAFGVLRLDVEGSIPVVVALAVLNALLGVALGLLASAFAQSEFQAVQFMPAFVLPQILLCGLLVPRDRMAEALEWVSVLLPLTWAYDGLARAVAGDDAALIARDAAIVVGVTLLALALGAATLRRRTP